MFITRKFLNQFFSTSVNIDKLSERLNTMGIINSKKNDAIYFEYPTIRPDCNSVYGILIEISAVLTDTYTPATQIIQNCHSLSYHKIEDDSVPFFVGCISENLIPDKINDSVFEVLKKNGLYSEKFHEILRNYCALFFGIVIDFIPDRWIKASNIDNLQIAIKSNNDGAYYILINDEKRVLYSKESLDVSSRFFVAPILDASIIKKTSTKSDKLYYYFIRQSNPYFANRMMEQLCDSNYQMYVGLRYCNKKKSFSTTLLFEDINKILGANYSHDIISYTLKKLGYNFSGFKVEIPPWREDIHNEQDIANDVFRILFTDNVFFEESNSIHDDIELYSKIYSLKCSLANNGFMEIMTRPFITKNDSIFLDSIFHGHRRCIKMRNAYDKTKPFLSCSNILSCQETMHSSKQNCFEISNIIYFSDNRYKETLSLSCAVKLSLSDSLYMPINLVWQQITHCNLLFEVMELDQQIIWRNKDSSILMCFSANHSKYIVMLIELNVNAILTGYVNHNDYAYQNVSDSLTREYSIDLPFSIPMSEIARLFSKPQFTCIKNIELKYISPYRQNDQWVLNYHFSIRFIGITKKELADLNKIMNDAINSLKQGTK